MLAALQHRKQGMALLWECLLRWEEGSLNLFMLCSSLAVDKDDEAGMCASALD